MPVLYRQNKFKMDDRNTGHDTYFAPVTMATRPLRSFKSGLGLEKKPPMVGGDVDQSQMHALLSACIRALLLRRHI